MKTCEIHNQSPSVKSRHLPFREFIKLGQTCPPFNTLEFAPLELSQKQSGLHKVRHGDSPWWATHVTACSTLTLKASRVREKGETKLPQDMGDRQHHL